MAISSPWPILGLCFTLFIAANALLGETEKLGTHETTDDLMVKHLATEALDRINYESEDPMHWKLGEITNSGTKVVNGISYTFTFELIKTNCNKEEDKERIALNLCAILEDALVKTCDFEVIVRKWDHSQEFINKGCSDVNKLRSYHLHPSEKNNKPQFRPIVDTEAENVFQISQHIRPKDFGAWNLFTGYISRYNKTYENKEEILRRFRVYKRNIRAAKMYQKSELGTAVYGESQFMDLTPSEFKRIMLPYVWQKPKNPIRQLRLDEIDDEPLPSAFDWRNKSVVTGVKNQGACGSCWAFSVTGNIEGQWAKKTGKLVSLSEQEILDCDGVDQACNGGLPMEAYKQIINMGGLESEAEYPYTKEKDACNLVKKDVVAYINDSVQLPPDEEKIATYLFKHGPISVGLNANTLQFYRHGITHPWKIFCSPIFVNHAVLLVGYGQEGSKPFWIVKNSWGPSWGENGYFRIYRGKNVCGINSYATSAIIN